MDHFERILNKLSNMSWEKIVAITFFIFFAAAAGLNIFGCGTLRVEKLEFVPIEVPVEKALKVLEHPERLDTVPRE